MAVSPQKGFRLPGSTLSSQLLLLFRHRRPINISPPQSLPLRKLITHELLGALDRLSVNTRVPQKSLRLRNYHP